MSKVKIQGNASGIGIFTVVAPATNTDRTITLPDVDATVFTTAGGTMTDSLMLQKTGGDIGLIIKETSATNYSQYVKLADSTTDWFMVNRYQDSGFGIGTTNAGNYLQIDTSGRVTKPYQPMFHVHNTTTPSTSTFSSGENTVLQFSTTKINVGNGWNSSTNRFTAPVTGKYYTYAQTRFDGLTGYSRLYISINGASSAWWDPGIHNISPNSSSAYWSSSVSGIVSLNAGDYIQCIGGANNGVGTHQGEGSFGAYLIG